MWWLKYPEAARQAAICSVCKRPDSADIDIGICFECMDKYREEQESSMQAEVELGKNETGEEPLISGVPDLVKLGTGTNDDITFE